MNINIHNVNSIRLTGVREIDHHQFVAATFEARTASGERIELNLFGEKSDMWRALTQLAGEMGAFITHDRLMSEVNPSTPTE